MGWQAWGGSFGQGALLVAYLSGCGGGTPRPSVLGVPDSAVLPATDSAIVPATDSAVVPASDSAVVPATDGAVVPATDAGGPPPTTPIVPGGVCATFVPVTPRTLLGTTSPHTAVTRPGQTTNVIVDRTWMFWTDTRAGTVYRALNNGAGIGAGTTALASGEDSPDGLARDGDFLYWISGDFDHASLRRMPVSGGTPVSLGRARRVTISDAVHRRIAFDPLNVYWADVGDEPFTNGAIYRVPKAGGTPSVVVSGLSNPASLAVDQCNLYWLDVGVRSSADGRTVYEGDLSTVPLTGGAPRVLAASQFNAGEVVVDANAIYWSAGGRGVDEGAIYRLPKSGGAPVTLASGLSIGRSLALDDRFVYTLDRGVVFVPLPGGTPEPHLTRLSYNSASGIAVGERGVYFAHTAADGRSTITLLPFAP